MKMTTTLAAWLFLAGSLSVFVLALYPFVRDAIEEHRHPRFTQEQLDREMAQWRADASASR